MWPRFNLFIPSRTVFYAIQFKSLSYLNLSCIFSFTRKCVLLLTIKTLWHVEFKISLNTWGNHWLTQTVSESRCLLLFWETALTSQIKHLQCRTETAQQLLTNSSHVLVSSRPLCQRTELRQRAGGLTWDSSQPDTCRGSGDLQCLCPGLQCVAECGGLFVEGHGTHHLVLFVWERFPLRYSSSGSPRGRRAIRSVPDTR